MTRLFLHFWNVAATFRIWSLGKKESVSQTCVVPFTNFGNWITSGPLRIKCLFYIWTTSPITVHTFAVVITPLHIWKYAVLLHLAWLSSKKLGFTLFLLYSHKEEAYWLRYNQCSLWGAQLRNCAEPPDYLRSEISFLRTCNFQI